MITFPKDFLWGASTSAYQVEGGNYNTDWWRWEQRPGRIADRRTSQSAADHATHFETDFDLLRKLGHNAHLFSVEWSRIQPEADHFDHEAMAHYAKVVDALARRGLEPVCILNHVTLPVWFARHGGWRHRDAAEVFGRFVERVVEALAPPCRRWIPVWEPEYLATMAWIEGVWPPGKPALWRVYTALDHLLRTHALSYSVIHRVQPDAAVGVSVRARRCRPLNAESAWDLRTARRENRRAVHLFPDAACNGNAPFPLGGARAMRDAADFIAVSYYGSERVRFHAGRPLRFFRTMTDPSGRPVRSSAYEPDPEGFTAILSELAQYERPILVTGNGVGTSDDSVRCRFLLNHLYAVQEAIASGSDVHGYFHRSFLDGFEWTDGYSVRYGLVHVDRETLARTPNPSAYLFKDICERGAIRSGTAEKFAPDWAVSAETS